MIKTTYPDELKISFINKQKKMKITLENLQQKEILENIFKNCHCFSSQDDNKLRIFDYELELSY